MDQKLVEKLKKLKAYDIVKAEDLPDIHGEGYLLKHKKSGARIMLLPNKDSNKVFNIAFRTPPTDSTGVPHIIEHTVLCGSKKYPLKDPFVELAKGSLNTFLNAMTYPDKTMYPVASTNDKDFKNLMDVYLDAVFYPNIYREEKLFRQEGWHYELENAQAPLTINGVVYNEMKGVFSSPDDILEREIFNSLFPDTPYGVESGGDPAVIPELTYEAFLDFHRRYYHPVNSYIYLYGDMDMVERLKYLDKEYLSAFDAISLDSSLPRQTAFPKKRVLETVYPISEEEEEAGKTYLSANFVGGDPLDAKEIMAIQILDYALFSSVGAPIKEALVKSGIGEDVYGTFMDGILQPYYSIVAKGTEASEKNRFLRIIKKELTRLAEEGLDKRSLKSGLNSLEFAYREADFSSYPKGLIYSIQTFDTWLYDDRHPFDGFKKLKAIRALKKEIAKDGPGYFEDLLRRLFLENEFASVLVMTPQKGLTRTKEEALKAHLASVKAGMTKKEVSAIVRETKALKAFQEAPDSEENLRKLPVLKRSDLNSKIVTYSNIEEELTGVPLVRHSYETNGIGYIHLLFDAGQVPEAFLPYMSLLKSLMGRMNTASYTYQELDHEIGIKTGSINVNLSFFNRPHHPEGPLNTVSVAMKALYGGMKDGFALIREIVETTDLSDTGRIREILKEIRSQTQAAFMQSGHNISALRAEAYYQSSSAYRDMCIGIGFYRSLGDIEAELEETPEMVVKKLELIRDMVFTRKNLFISFTSGEEGAAKIRKAAEGFIRTLPVGRTLTKRQQARPYGNLKEAFTTSGQVQFVAQSGDFVHGPYKDNGYLLVLRQILNYEYLWQNIRVTGGAYGCGAAFSENGTITFRTYRDPHLMRSLDVYDRLPVYLEKFEASEETMTKYVIGAVSTITIPLTPSLYERISLNFYLNDVKDEERQERLDQVLSATAEDIRNQADLVKYVLKSGNICVIGSEAAIERHKYIFDKVEGLL